MHTFIRNIFLYIFLLSAVSAFAQTEDKVVVHLKDGKTTEYLLNDVDYMELVTNKQASRDIVEGVGGTIANAVDLGLSVLWADHNLGATETYDYGGRFAQTDDALSAWGDDWRLPTQEEWQELYESCTWQWKVINGVGGRVVSANGNNIFLPAAGVQFEKQPFVVGSLGLYWTSTRANDAEEATGAYFDSANIYRMDFARTNLFSVRLVKNK